MHGFMKKKMIVVLMTDYYIVSCLNLLICTNLNPLLEASRRYL